MKPYYNDEFSNYLVESASQFFDRYGKMYGENVESEQIDEDSRRISNKQRAAHVRRMTKGGTDYSVYTPPKNWDPKADRGKGAVLRDKQVEKQRRKALAKSAMSKQEESFDLNDILELLIDEGYAGSEIEALDIIEEMSDADFEDLLEWSPGAASREYAVRRQKEIEGTSAALKGGKIQHPKHREAAVKALQSQRMSRKASSDKYSGKAAEVRKQARLAKAKKMADERRAKEAAAKPKGLAARAKSAIKKALRRESFDIYDVVLQYILDEGYAVSFQDAFGIMADLDEDTICDILEEVGYEYLD